VAVGRGKDKWQWGAGGTGDSRACEGQLAVGRGRER